MASITSIRGNSRKDFDDFILEKDHPCIMARTVFSMDQVDYHEYEEFGSRETAISILKDLRAYLDNYDFNSNDFRTFLAVFPTTKKYTEEAFEEILWQQVNHLHQQDNAAWDEHVASDPEDPKFSLSLAGQSFYLVGMHPNSSRKARQAPFPAIAFNLHWQFERLREMNAYTNVRDKIRQRDKQLQGSINPMLSDFGEESEARQYSGRKVGDDWKCPFLHKKK